MSVRRRKDPPDPLLPVVASFVSARSEVLILKSRAFQVVELPQDAREAPDKPVYAGMYGSHAHRRRVLGLPNHACT